MNKITIYIESRIDKNTVYADFANLDDAKKMYEKVEGKPAPSNSFDVPTGMLLILKKSKVRVNGYYDMDLDDPTIKISCNKDQLAMSYTVEEIN